MNDTYEEDVSWIRPNLSQSGFTWKYPSRTNCVICLCPIMEMNVDENGRGNTQNKETNQGRQELEAYLWLPIMDHPSQVPTVTWLDLVAHMIGEWLQAGRCVHVQCYAGLSRSTLVNCAYLMCYEHLSAEEAMAEIRSLRAYAQPNSGFVTLLQNYERYLHPVPGI